MVKYIASCPTAMPIPTSSLHDSPRQRARRLWSEFRLYAIKAHKGMISRRTMALQELAREWQLQPTRSQRERTLLRENLVKLHEKQHFLEMREEWQRILHSNGLQHEDWGDVTPSEMAQIRQVLGPDDIEDDNDDDDDDNDDNDEIHDVAAQPLTQSMSSQSSNSYYSYTAPCLPSRSQNSSSSASYAFVDPSKFTDDERDDFSIITTVRSFLLLLTKIFTTSPVQTK